MISGLRWTGTVMGAALMLAGLAACSKTEESTSSAAPVVQSQAPATSSLEQLRNLFEQTWQRRLARSPIMATYLGDTRYNDRWDDMSQEAFEAELEQDNEALRQLRMIDRADLPASEQLNYDLFLRDLEDRIEGAQFHGELMAINQLEGVHLLGEIVEFTPFNTLKDYENWLSRLQAYDLLVDQNIALLRRGISTRRLRPRIVMRRVLPQIESQLVSRANESVFFKPFESMPESVPEEVAVQLELAAQSIVMDTVVPALRRLHQFLEQEYIPACPENDMGLMHQHRGSEYYGWLVRHHTSTTLTPDAIHEIGLREVERLTSEINVLMRDAGHRGSISRFKEKLSWNPRYRYKKADDLLDAYRAIGKRIDPELPRLFGRLPRTPYGVRAIPEVSESSAPAAYYYPPSADGRRAGYFYANTSKLSTRHGWEMDALTAHEAVPGHHLQMALANELTDVPDFRRLGLELNAFVEGWGLYAESLGTELGLYKNYGARFGRLSFELWRAVRLVVDTGLHAKGWTRRKAREYAAQHVPKSSSEIAVEVDRYIAMPGQALAYKIGAMKIVELRDKAKEKLGPRFDIRDFHDVVLGSGPLPLDLLEQNVDVWIEAASADGTAASQPPQ